MVLSGELVGQGHGFRQINGLLGDPNWLFEDESLHPAGPILPTVVQHTLYVNVRVFVFKFRRQVETEHRLVFQTLQLTLRSCVLVSNELHTNVI